MKLPFKILKISHDKIYDQLFFPQENGWQGGDAACSIKMGNGKVLWLFGDTIIGKFKNGIRNVQYPHINNSIAITKHYKNGKIDVKYYWKSLNGNPSSFFSNSKIDKNIYYWPTNGALINNMIIIFCFSVKGNFKGQYLDFWSTVGTNMIIVKNPYDHPEKWQLENIELGIGNDNFGIHSALYYHSPELYFIGYKTDLKDDKYSILAKINFQKLIKSKTFNHLLYFSNRNSKNNWSPNLNFASEIFSPGNTESSIVFLENRKIFLCTTYNPLINELCILFSSKITGPWTGPFVVYKNPDHLNMTYAFRIHQALMKDESSIIFSYISSPERDIRNDVVDPKFYRPRFLKMDIV